MNKSRSFSSINPLMYLSLSFVALFLVSAAACGSAASSESVKDTQEPTVGAQVDRPEKGFDHSAYESLLKKYVDENGKVDYAGLQANDRAALDAYLKSLGDADDAALDSDDERNAFFINAYNAYTIRDVLDDVYGKTDSVKKVDGFWDKKKHRIAGKEMTLDETEKVSRDLKDPRIHFAVNCASLGCPKLQRFAFSGPKFQEQMAFVTKDFLADTERGLKIDRAKNKIWISKIFSWYAGDFSGDTSGFGFVKGFIKSKFTASVGKRFIFDKVPEDVMEYIKEKDPDISYLDYDWTLNSQIPPAKK
ncbi:MAG: DUF547 domain-containing protein [Pyrinomonadaceae bacterium]